MGFLTDGITELRDRAVHRIGFSGTALKIIACVIMVVDHAGLAVLNPYINVNVGNMTYEKYVGLTELLANMRLIGRIAFPIFCFLLVEGFLHTRSFWKYVRNLAIFAVISEPAFDLSLFQRPVYFKYQNVYFTLLIGLLCLGLLKLLMERPERLFYIGKRGRMEEVKGKAVPEWLVFLSCIAVVSGSMAIAWFLKTDYSFKGVLVIVLMYLFRRNIALRLVLGELPLYYEPAAFFSMIPLFLYNNKRGGLKSAFFKYFFYAFYPLHLTILYLISAGLGCR